MFGKFMKIKKAFTLSEVLITLVIICVISVVLTPVIKSFHVDKDAVTYQKAVYNISSAFLKATEDSDVYYCQSDWQNCNTVNLCEELSKQMNVSAKINCNKTETSSYTYPNFVTADGIRYWGLESDFSDKTKIIYIDRKLKADEMTESELKRRRDSYHKTPGMKIVLKAEGGVLHPSGDEYNFENNILKKFMILNRSKS